MLNVALCFITYRVYYSSPMWSVYTERQSVNDQAIKFSGDFSCIFFQITFKYITKTSPCELKSIRTRETLQR